METVPAETAKKLEIKNEIASLDEVKEEIKIICRSKAKIDQLTYYALSKIRWFFYDDVCNGSSAVDVMQIIFEKFLTGKRRWFKKDGRTFENQFFMTIHSYVKNEFKKTYRKEVDKETGEIVTKKKGPIIFSIFDSEGITNELLLRDEKRYLDEIENENDFYDSAEIQIEKIKKALINDFEAWRVFEALLKEGNSDIKISETLGMPIEKVRNAKKRIKRKHKEIFTLNT
ncbi:MAG: hypothetical protein H6609_17410 [Ignavibacteriales bacterium]|nr:hypothetical protein [Ignavibacteriales bacterium]